MNSRAAAAALRGFTLAAFFFEGAASIFLPPEEDELNAFLGDAADFAFASFAIRLPSGEAMKSRCAQVLHFRERRRRRLRFRMQSKQRVPRMEYTVGFMRRHCVGTFWLPMALSCYLWSATPMRSLFLLVRLAVAENLPDVQLKFF